MACSSPSVPISSAGSGNIVGNILPCARTWLGVGVGVKAGVGVRAGVGVYGLGWC